MQLTGIDTVHRNRDKSTNSMDVTKNVREYYLFSFTFKSKATSFIKSFVQKCNLAYRKQTRTSRRSKTKQ